MKIVPPVGGFNSVPVGRDYIIAKSVWATDASVMRTNHLALVYLCHFACILSGDSTFWELANELLKVYGQI
jgi:hypothetical protein